MNTFAFNMVGVSSTQLIIVICSHSEKNYQDIANYDKTYLVGLCSGLFAASAIASASSLSSLVPIAVQAVLLAFRTGVHVEALAERLHPVGEQSESWTHIFPGVKEAQARAALVKFQESHVSTIISRAA